MVSIPPDRARAGSPSSTEAASAPSVHAFDGALHQANQWLKDVMDHLQWNQPQRVYLALRSTLHALRDRLTVEEAAQFAAQLPMLIRGVFYEGWRPSAVPVRMRHKQEFLDQVQNECRVPLPMDIEQIVRGIFEVLTRHISPGEVHDVMQLMPEELRDLWPRGERTNRPVQ